MGQVWANWGLSPIRQFREGRSKVSEKNDKQEQVEKLQKGTAKLYVGILAVLVIAVVIWMVISNL